MKKSMVEGQFKKCKVAWGITGGGDKIAEIVQIMTELKNQYEHKVEIHVFVSKAGEVMLRFYKQYDQLKQTFPNFSVEMNANSPFLAAWMQSGKYEFLLVAPATSNSVAKIANGIGDTLITNSVIMSLKAFAQVYVLPTDYREGVVSTLLPNGKEIKLRIRKEEADQTRKLEQMDCMHVLDSPQEIQDIFKEYFSKP